MYNIFKTVWNSTLYLKKNVSVSPTTALAFGGFSKMLKFSRKCHPLHKAVRNKIKFPERESSVSAVFSDHVATSGWCWCRPKNIYLLLERKAIFLSHRMSPTKPVVHNRFSYGRVWPTARDKDVFPAFKIQICSYPLVTFFEGMFAFPSKIIYIFNFHPKNIKIL